MKQSILAIIFILFVSNIYCHEKTIKGDTAFWFNRNEKIINTVGLKDLSNTKDEFNFRFRNHGQVIELTKNNDTISGVVVNYTYHITNYKKNKEGDIVFTKDTINTKTVDSIYQYIINSSIVNIPSDKDIKGWYQGVDGTTYIIEHSDKENYWFKNYWTPSASFGDSIPEAFIISNFVDTISFILDLGQKYKVFKNGLPEIGCYTSGGGTTMCHPSNSIRIGYSGSTKLPYGYNLLAIFNNIGKTKTNFEIGLNHKFDLSGNFDLSSGFSKWQLFLEKDSRYQDFINYSYRIRQFDSQEIKLQNHTIVYGLTLKNGLSVSLGSSYLIEEKSKWGLSLNASKWFDNQNFKLLFESSTFKDNFNYKVGINKYLRIKRKSIGIGVYYEDFEGYKDVSALISMSIN